MTPIIYSLVLFIIGIFIIFETKPMILFTEKGTFREFGAGYTKKTILPIWLFVIFWAITSYLIIQTYFLVN